MRNETKSPNTKAVVSRLCLCGNIPPPTDYSSGLVPHPTDGPPLSCGAMESVSRISAAGEK